MADNYSLVSMKIINFLGLEDVNINFTNKDQPRKIMTIFGHQGSGKTTILRAIQWCAYGTKFRDKFHPLSRTKIFPLSWSGNQQGDIVVSMRFRSFNSIEPDNDIQCKRTLSINSDIDKLEVSVGDENFDRFKSENYFSQIFGKNPGDFDAVMWLIRQEEMLTMSKTISQANNSTNSYFLNFMNLDVSEDALSELLNTNLEEIDRIGKGQGIYTPEYLNNINTSIKDLELKIQDYSFKLNVLMSDKKNFSLNAQEEKAADLRESFISANQELNSAKIELANLKIKRGEVPELFHALMAAKLIKKEIEIDQSFDGSKFEWGEIATYLSKTNRIPNQYIDIIRSIGNGSGYDTSNLFNAKQKISSWESRIRKLKSALTRYHKAALAVDDFTKNGITDEKTASAVKKMKERNKINEEFKDRELEIGLMERNLKAQKKERAKATKSLKAESEKRERLDELKRINSVIYALKNSIALSNEDYIKEMFDSTIQRVKQYWNEIDLIGKYEPMLEDNENPEFVLRRKKDGKIVRISDGANISTAAGGEQQLLLVCTCLAVSESSGAKMPMILDDCFTDIDKKTREKLVEVVAKKFGSMILVTNDPDKGKLLKNSDGVLNLQWPSKWNQINQSNYTEWHKWTENVNG